VVKLSELLPPGVAARLAALAADSEAGPALAAAEDGGKEKAKKAKARRRKARKEARRRERALAEMCRGLASDPEFEEAVWEGRARRVLRLVEDRARESGVAFRDKRAFWTAVREATRLVAVGQ
jgi:hypothetical protein